MIKSCQFLLLLLTSCVVHPPSGRLQVAAGYCDPPLPYRYDSAFAPKADFAAALTPSLLARYPRRNLLTANAAGLLPQLNELLALETQARQHPTYTAKVAALRQRQLMLAQLTLVSTTVASMAAELDCEGERADQVAGYLREQDNKRTQRLNVFSISIGVTSGLGTTVIENKPGQYAFGIGGGLLAAGLGLLTLMGNHTAEFTHQRNLLTDVWAEKPASSVFPPSVWYLLSEPAFSNGGQTSIAHNTRQRWQHYGQLAKPTPQEGKRLAVLLFGVGDRYDADNLEVSANMLNELQAAVRLLNQELQGLLLVLNESPR
jgi:hypothetical protein